MAISALEAMKASYAKRLYVPPDDVAAVEFVAATLLANQMAETTDPIWGWLIAPSGGGKNEFTRPYHGHPTTVFVSAMTANSLVSGHLDEDNPDFDPSLLGQLDHKTMIYQDFTNIIESGEQMANKILGDLRAVYGDEVVVKASGTAGRREYHAKFGIIFGVTPYIDSYATRHQQLGTRFLSCRMNRNAASRGREARHRKLQYIRRGMETKNEWRPELSREIQEAFDKALVALEGHDPVSMDDATNGQVVALADVVSYLRTAPVRGVVTEPEGGGRILQQLIRLGIARVILDDRSVWDWRDTAFIVRIACDTLPRDVTRLLHTLLPDREGDGKYPAEPPSVALDVVRQRAYVPGYALSGTLRQWQYLGILEDSRDPVRLTTSTYKDLTTSGILDGEKVTT